MLLVFTFFTVPSEINLYTTFTLIYMFMDNMIRKSIFSAYSVHILNSYATAMNKYTIFMKNNSFFQTHIEHIKHYLKNEMVLDFKIMVTFSNINFSNF